MRIEGREVELAGDEEQHGSHGFEASVSARLALGRLKQAVDGFNEALVWRVWAHATMPSK